MKPNPYLLFCFTGVSIFQFTKCKIFNKLANVEKISVVEEVYNSDYTKGSVVDVWTDVNQNIVNTTYPTMQYQRYVGEDYTSLYSSSVQISKDGKLAAVGANGYGKFTGMVQVYKVNSSTSWNYSTTIYSPAGKKANFGVSVALDGNLIIVGANAYNIFTGRAYIYHPSSENDYKVMQTLKSPLGKAEGFGFSVAIQNNFAMVGCSNNGAFIYERLQKRNEWVLTTSLRLEPYDDQANVDSHFGSSVAIFGNFSVIGSSGFGMSAGRVYIYSFTSSGKSWSLFQVLENVAGYNSYFGTSVSIYNRNLIVGAPGYRPNLYHGHGHATDWANASAAHIYYLQDLVVNDTAVDYAWVLNATLNDPVQNNSYFGISVDIVEQYAIVGATGFPNGNETGVSFLFSRTVTPNITVRNIPSLSPTFIPSQEPTSNLNTTGQSQRYLGDFNTVLSVDSSRSLASLNSIASIPSPYYDHHQQELYHTEWNLNITFTSPAGKDAYFGFAVSVAQDFALIGAFGWVNLQGAVFFASIPAKSESNFIPTSQPTIIGVVNQNRGGTPTVFGITLSPVIILSIIGAGLIALLMLMLLAYVIYTYCCCCFGAAGLAALKKKKKKKEEEEGPHTVHFKEHDEDFWGEGVLIQPSGRFGQMPVDPSISAVKIDEPLLLQPINPYSRETIYGYSTAVPADPNFIRDEKLAALGLNAGVYPPGTAGPEQGGTPSYGLGNGLPSGGSAGMADVANSRTFHTTWSGSMFIGGPSNSMNGNRSGEMLIQDREVLRTPGNYQEYPPPGYLNTNDNHPMYSSPSTLLADSNLHSPPDGRANPLRLSSKSKYAVLNPRGLPPGESIDLNAYRARRVALPVVYPPVPFTGTHHGNNQGPQLDQRNRSLPPGQDAIPDRIAPSNPAESTEIEGIPSGAFRDDLMPSFKSTNSYNVGLLDSEELDI